MILDIRFRDSGPVQYQNVSHLHSFYVGETEEIGEASIVIHFRDRLYPVMVIPARRLLAVLVTND